jgi:hypothetical protein
VPARTDDKHPPRGTADTGGRSVLATAVWSGGASAVLGASIGVAIALVCWLPDAGVSGHPLSAVRAGLLGFVAAQHAGITVDGVPTAFVPLGATIIVGLIAWRAGAVLADAADRHAETRGNRLAAALAVQALSYALASTFVAVMGTLGTSSASPLPTAVASCLLFGAVAGASLCRSPVLIRWWRARLAEYVVDGMRAAAAALAVLIAAGALLVAGSLLMHADRVMRLSGLVGGGVSGLAVLLVSVLCAPNAAVVAGTYVTGAGFAIGNGTIVSPFSTSHGTLPAFPILGAVPDGHGADPFVLSWLVVALVGTGGAAACLLRRRPRAGALRALGIAAAASGMALAVLAWLSGGAIGAGRLRTVGASPWRVGAWFALEVAVVGLAVLAGDWLWQWVRTHLRHDENDESEEPVLISAGDPAGQ